MALVELQCTRMELVERAPCVLAERLDEPHAMAMLAALVGAGANARTVSR